MNLEFPREIRFLQHIEKRLNHRVHPTKHVVQTDEHVERTRRAYKATEVKRDRRRLSLISDTK